MNKLKRGFYRNSEGRIVQNWPARVGPVSDDIMVGLYVADGGSKFEFKIEQYVFDRGEDGIRVCVFDDAFEAFTHREFAPLFKWLAKERPKTLDAVQAWLEKHGYVNHMREAAKKKFEQMAASRNEDDWLNTEYRKEIERLKEIIDGKRLHRV